MMAKEAERRRERRVEPDIWDLTDNVELVEDREHKGGMSGNARAGSGSVTC